MPQGRKARLAGFVLSLMGLGTCGVTSPFGLLLSLEKYGETERKGWLAAVDITGIILGAPGTLLVPFFLYAMWNYPPVGPVPVLIYLMILIPWTWHRLRVAWPQAHS